jgi:predicted aspartyl protease
MLAFFAAMCAHTLVAVHSEKDMIKGTSKRLVLTAKANGKEVQCLVDTGTSISVVSSDTFKRMWQHWEVFQLPMPRRLRVA